MIQKLRRQSVKGKSSLKGKFGLSNKSSTYRSKSFIVSPTQEVVEFKETQRYSKFKFNTFYPIILF